MVAGMVPEEALEGAVNKQMAVGYVPTFEAQPPNITIISKIPNIFIICP